jgi:beta propeller repeat protein
VTDFRDNALGDGLDDLRLPDHRPGYWAALEADLETEADVLYQERDHDLGDRLGALPLPGHRDDYWCVTGELLRADAHVVALSRPRRSRRFVATIAAIATVAASILVSAWFGLPGPVGGTDRAIAHGFLSPLQTSLSPAWVDGDTLYWVSRRAPDFDAGPGDVTVFARDVTGGEPFALDTHRSAKLQPTSSQGLVAWLDDRDGQPAIYAYDLGTRTERRIAVIGDRRAAWEAPLATDPATAHLGEPAVDGSRVVWTDEAGDVRGYDLASGSPFGVATQSWGEREPAISGDTVVWSDGRGTTWGIFGTYMNGWEIWARDLVTWQPVPICEAPGDQVAPAISGSVIVWQDGRRRTTRQRDAWDIYGYDLRTKREFSIATGPGAQTSPAISGDFVVWADSGAVDESAEGSGDYVTIEGYDLRTGRYFTVSEEPGFLQSPSISSHRIVWSAVGAKGELAVYGATITRHGSRVRVSPLEP